MDLSSVTALLLKAKWGRGSLRLFFMEGVIHLAILSVGVVCYIVPLDQRFAKYNFVEICFVLLRSVLELRER